MNKLNGEDKGIICISGGFDPLHEGHISLIEHAAKYGDVVVILNSDEWLQRKKGFVFQSWNARAIILNALHNVSNVIGADDTDGTVCNTLQAVKPDYFANGGDRTLENTPELKLCLDLGIKPLFNIGGSKIASSSDLVRALNYG